MDFIALLVSLSLGLSCSHRLLANQLLDDHEDGRAKRGNSLPEVYHSIFSKSEVSAAKHLYNEDIVPNSPQTPKPPPSPPLPYGSGGDDPYGGT